MIGIITALMIAQQAIQSTTVPPSTEERITFTHAGYTYYVGKTTGNVTVFLAGGQPTPPDEGRPKPPPVINGAAWLSLIIDPNSAEQQAWRTDGEVRTSLQKAGVEYRTYASTEQDIDQLGFRSELTANGSPLVIVQDKAGKVIQAKQVKTLDELKAITKGLKS